MVNQNAEQIARDKIDEMLREQDGLSKINIKLN